MVNSLFASFSYEGDVNINDKTQAKMKEMGDELYAKTGISTVIVAYNSLDKKTFLQIKDKYLKELKDPYILWMFSKKYTDGDRTGKLNLLIPSESVKGKYDESSLFSPFGGSFTKLIVIQKSKVDPTAAAFLNGYADLVDMLADSHGVKLASSIGDETRKTMDVARIAIYLSFAFFFLWFLKVRFFNKEKNSG